MKPIRILRKKLSLSLTEDELYQPEFYSSALSIPFEFFPPNYLNQFYSQKCLLTLLHRLKNGVIYSGVSEPSRGQQAGLGRPVAEP